ncbi:MAG: S8 family serine peptidase [Phycisphaerae bacterium]|nr:S8 family serine peptidase [Phycisphaerae bacterium]
MFEHSLNASVVAAKGETGSASAAGAAKFGSPLANPAAHPDASAALALTDSGDLQAYRNPLARTHRAPYPKVPTDQLRLPVNAATGQLSYTGRIIVKLHDDIGARAPKTAPTDRLVSINGRDVSSFDLVLARYSASVQSWITHRSDDQLRAIELRAEAKSGRGQPDLASYVVVSVQPGRELIVARALNELDIVEFVELERPLETHQTVTGCVPNNTTMACNFPGNTCADPAAGLGCNPDPGCVADDPTICEAGCADAACCQLVSTYLAYCSDTDFASGWDVFCAAYANLLCDGSIYDAGAGPPPGLRYDPCFSDGAGAPNPLFVDIVPLLAGGCFEVHDFRGCDRPECCFAVCSLDVTCCTITWDATCVSLASSEALTSVCRTTPIQGPTPNFKGELKNNPNYPAIGEVPLFAAGWQTYLFAEPTIGEFAAPPPAIDDFVFLSNKFRGGGLDLTGVRELQTQFANVYQGGAEPILNGAGIKIGVIDFSAHVNHEEFVTGSGGIPLLEPRVILEPGQTPILIGGGANDPDHGTACLGMLVASDNGVGVTGIAHEAQGYFFPALSLEQGSRLPNAFTSAAETFADGDVLSVSIGFPGAGPLTLSESIGGLIGLASDLGITVVVSAGNDAIPIAASPFETGAIVVGAAWPGQSLGVAACGNAFYHYCRMFFSNFTGDGTVHVSGWGAGVTTCGYGDLHTGANGSDPEDPETNNLRRYTSRFNGTSAAAPMIAGLAAVLQGWSKQLYGSPITPIQMRDVVSTASRGEQCYSNGLTAGPDSIGCNGPVSGETLPLIGAYPDALESGFAILNGQFVSGNSTDVKIVYGDPLASSPPSSFRIRALDGNYLKIVAKYATAGTTNLGLSYLATGYTTDLIAVVAAPALDPDVLQGISLIAVSSATKPFVIMGGFLYNWSDERWDFVGINFIGPGLSTNVFAVNQFLLPKYFGPGGKVQARLWTCGLGNVTSHQVWHDLIQLNVTGGILNP